METRLESITAKILTELTQMLKNKKRNLTEKNGIINK